MTETNSNGGVRLYVGNLPYALRSNDLYKMFADFGKVSDAVVMMENGQQDRSKGFGFVTMESRVEAEVAAEAINGRNVLGRVVVCNIAKPREPKLPF
jgi:RNA recognition motif-containing protein